MESFEQEGKTIDEAIRLAAYKLGFSSDDLQIEILDEGTKGVFNLIGARNAKIKVTPKYSYEELIKRAVDNILKMMKIDAQLNVSIQKDVYYVNITTIDAEKILIGKNGYTLDAFQHIVNRIVSRFNKNGYLIVLDVNGIKADREKQLREKALSIAAKVKSTKKEIILNPLVSAERLIIHQTLDDDKDVKTYTVGQGEYRSVVISPATHLKK